MPGIFPFNVLDHALNLPQNRFGDFVCRLANGHLHGPGVKITDFFKRFRVDWNGQAEPVRGDVKGAVDGERLEYALGDVLVQSGHEALRPRGLKVVAVYPFSGRLQNTLIEL